VKSAIKEKNFYFFKKDSSSVTLRATPSPAGEGFLSAFSFAKAGAKEKAIKKKTPMGRFRALRSATKATRL